MSKASKWNPIRNGALDERAITSPLRWKAARVVALSVDPFADDVPSETADRFFAVMALSPRHAYTVKTEQIDRLRAYFADMPDRCEAIRETPEVEQAQYDVDGFDDLKSPAECAHTLESETGMAHLGRMWDGEFLPNVTMFATVRVTVGVAQEVTHG